MGGVGGFRRICKRLFTGFVNQLTKLDPNDLAHAADLRHRQDTIPDLMLDATLLNSTENVAKIPRRPHSCGHEDPCARDSTLRVQVNRLNPPR